MTLRPCSFEGCTKIGKLTKGLCPTHYMRLLRNGDPHIVKPPGIVGEGRAKHRMYPAWQQMILRCHDPKNSVYPRYGARGVTVCVRWREDFLNFLADMGERPDGMTLDRIDPTGPYSPDNCRWADAKTQRKNLSVAGDARARKAISEAKSAYWRRWREARGLAADAPTRAQYRGRSATGSNLTGHKNEGPRFK